MPETWVNLVPNTPIEADFISTGGRGTPLVIDAATGTLFYWDQAVKPVNSYNIVTPEFFGAKGDGVTNDNAAIAAAFAASNTVYFGSKTYLLDQILLSGNKTVLTEGFETVFMQAPGQPVGTPILKGTGTQLKIGSAKYIGNIATDTSEFNHAIMITTALNDIESVEIGDCWCVNIRGDGIIFYTPPATGRIIRARYGSVLLDNVFRNGVSIVSEVADIEGGTIEPYPGAVYGAGLWDYDIEPDPNTGSCGRAYVSRIYGRRAAIAGSGLIGDIIQSAEFGELDLNPNHHSGSNPAYLATINNSFQMRDVESVEISRFKSEATQQEAFVSVGGGILPKMSAHITSAEIPSGNLEDLIVRSFFSGGVGLDLTIDNLIATMANSVNQCCVANINDFKLGPSTITVQGAGRVFGGVSGVAEEIDVNGSLNLASFALNCDDFEVNGGTITGLAGLFAFSSRTIGRRLNATVTGAYLNNVTDGFIEHSILGGTYYIRYQPGGLNIDANGINLGAGTLNLTGVGAIYQIAGTQVLGPRNTGWTADTGTAEKTAHATYTAPVISNPPTQAEVQAIANALQNTSRGQKALKDAFIGHGAIGT